MTTEKTGRVILKGKNYDITEALPTSRVYKRGYRVGGFYSGQSPKGTPATPSGRSKKTKPQN